MRSPYKHYEQAAPVHIVQNDNEDFTLKFWEYDRDEDGNIKHDEYGAKKKKPIDISGWTFYLAIKRDPITDDDASAIVFVTKEVDDGTSGEVQLEYSCAEYGRFYADILSKQPGSARKTVHQFIIEVSPESARAQT